jgi:hypothetical protein
MAILEWSSITVAHATVRCQVIYDADAVLLRKLGLQLLLVPEHPVLPGRDRSPERLILMGSPASLGLASFFERSAWDLGHPGGQDILIQAALCSFLRLLIYVFCITGPAAPARPSR